MTIYDLLENIIKSVEHNDVNRLHDIQNTEMVNVSLNFVQGDIVNNLLDVAIEAVEFRVENTKDPVPEKWTLEDIDKLDVIMTRTAGRDYYNTIAFDKKNDRCYKFTVKELDDSQEVINVIQFGS